MSGGWSRLERGPEPGKHIWSAVKFGLCFALGFIIIAAIVGAST